MGVSGKMAAIIALGLCGHNHLERFAQQIAAACSIVPPDAYVMIESLNKLNLNNKSSKDEMKLLAKGVGISQNKPERIPQHIPFYKQLSSKGGSKTRRKY